MRATTLAVILIVAVQQAIFLGVLLVGLFSSDPLGAKIARGLLAVVSVPFLVFTLPAIIMALNRRSPTVALALAALGLVATWLAWLKA